VENIFKKLTALSGLLQAVIPLNETPSDNFNGWSNFNFIIISTVIHVIANLFKDREILILYLNL